MKHNFNPKVIATGLFNVADQNDDLDKVRDALRTLNHIVIDSGQFRALVQSKKIKGELKVEILDNEGETIYTEPVPNYLEGTARRVSMEVYSETAPGAATIHILGELAPAEYTTQTGQVIPAEFQGAYNVRWTRQFYVNTAIPNTFPILFYRQPQVRLFEILKGHQITPPEPIRTIESGSLSLLPTPAGQQEIPPSMFQFMLYPEGLWPSETGPLMCLMW